VESITLDQTKTTSPLLKLQGYQEYKAKQEETDMKLATFCSSLLRNNRELPASPAVIIRPAPRYDFHLRGTRAYALDLREKLEQYQLTTSRWEERRGKTVEQFLWGARGRPNNRELSYILDSILAGVGPEVPDEVRIPLGMTLATYQQLRDSPIAISGVVKNMLDGKSPSLVIRSPREDELHEQLTYARAAAAQTWSFEYAAKLNVRCSIEEGSLEPVLSARALLGVVGPYARISVELDLKSTPDELRQFRTSHAKDWMIERDAQLSVMVDLSPLLKTRPSP